MQRDIGNAERKLKDFVCWLLRYTCASKLLSGLARTGDAWTTVSVRPAAADHVGLEYAEGDAQPHPLSLLSGRCIVGTNPRINLSLITVLLSRPSSSPPSFSLPLTSFSLPLTSLCTTCRKQLPNLC